MYNDNLKKMVEFLNNHNDIQSFNDAIREVELKAMEEVKEVEEFAKSRDVTISLRDSNHVERMVLNLTGIWKFIPEYNRDLKIVTCQLNEWFLIWYHARDSITDYYTYINAEIKNDTIIFKHDPIKYDREGQELIKEYQNGKTIYRLTSDLKEHYDLIKWIESFFDDKNCR